MKGRKDIYEGKVKKEKQVPKFANRNKIKIKERKR
jgi:hypothetical protein